MKNIKYKLGNAVEPIGDDNKIIVHICNNIGAWGAGFVLAISTKWPHVESEYRSMFTSGLGPNIGHVQFVVAQKHIVIANLIGQEGIGRTNIPIRYKAVEEGLQKVRALAEKYNTSIHMPRIGCGLAGGKWEEIEKILHRVFDKTSIEIIVYDLK